MGTSINAATITVDTGGLEEAVRKGLEALNRIEKAVVETAKSTKETAEHMNALHGAMEKVVGIGERFLEWEAIKHSFEAVVDAEVELEDSMLRLEGVFEATDGHVGRTIEQLNNLAEEMSDKTMFDDKQFRSAEATLMRFDSLRGEMFEKALKSSADLAAAMGGDAASAAARLGRALEDPTRGSRMLYRAGILLTASQKEQIKDAQEHGNKLEAQKVLLDAVAAHTNGLAEKMHSGLHGAQKDANEGWDHFKEAIGQVVAIPLIPFLQKTAELLNTIGNMGAKSGKAGALQMMELYTQELHQIDDALDGNTNKRTEGLTPDALRQRRTELENALRDLRKQLSGMVEEQNKANKETETAVELTDEQIRMEDELVKKMDQEMSKLIATKGGYAGLQAATAGVATVVKEIYGDDIARAASDHKIKVASIQASYLEMAAAVKQAETNLKGLTEKSFALTNKLEGDRKARRDYLDQIIKEGNEQRDKHDEELQSFIDNQKKMSRTTEELWVQAAHNIESTMASTMQNVLMGQVRTIRDFTLEVINDIQAIIANYLASMAGAGLLGWLSGMHGPDALSSIPGILNSGLGIQITPSANGPGGPATPLLPIGGPSAKSISASPVVHLSMPISVSALDGQSAVEALTRHAPVIQGIVVDGITKSRAMQQAVQRLR